MPFLFLKHVNNPHADSGGFLLCLHFVYLLKHLLAYIYEKDLFIFANPGCCIGGTVSETPYLSVQRLFACCAQCSSGESGLGCIYGLLCGEGIGF